MFVKRRLQGVTLIEVMIATSVFIIGLGAMLTSAVALFSNAIAAGDYLIASNLAREAVEIARNQRDDNFVKHDIWNSDLTTSPAVIKPNLSGGFRGRYIIETVTYTMDQCLVNHNCQLSYDPESGLYGDRGMVLLLPRAVVTKFHRLLQFTPKACNADMIAADLCDAGETIGLTVASSVKWFQGAKLKEVVVNADLYNWY